MPLPQCDCLSLIHTLYFLSFALFYKEEKDKRETTFFLSTRRQRESHLYKFKDIEVTFNASTV